MSRSKGPSTTAIVLLLGLGAMGLAAVAAYVRLTPADQVPVEVRRVDPLPEESPVREQPKQDEPIDISPAPKKTPTVLVPVIDGDRIRMKPVPYDGATPAEFAVDQALAAAKVDAKALSIRIEDRTAVIDFPLSVEQGFGSVEEGLVIQAIQRAVGQFDSIDQVQFLVDGRKVDSIGGHIETLDAMPVIRPDAKPGAERP